MAKDVLRFLVLDDTKYQRDTYAADVKEFFPASEIDAVGTKAEAIERVRHKTYHAALLDIMLTDNPHNTEGLDVLDSIAELAEGTRVVMLSAIEVVDAPVRALRSRVAVDYIMKKELTENREGFAKPIHVVALEKAISEAHIPIFGSLGRLTSYLAAPEDPGIWEYKAMTLLKAQGMESLSGFLSDFLKPLFPLLPLKNSSPMNADAVRDACYGQYWSKAIGRPIWVCLSREEKEFYVPPEAGQMIGREHKRQKLKGAVWHLSADRALFVDRIWDVGKPS